MTLGADAKRRRANGEGVATTPLRDHVGIVEDGMALSIRGALASAARSLGHETPADDRIAELRAALAAESVPEIDLSGARRRVAETSGEEEALRERVASLRGRVAALRDAGIDPESAREALRGATRRLSEVETERLAAEQALDAARRASRATRDRRERRLRREDRLANAERRARRTLADGIANEFERAVAIVPGAGTVGSRPSEFEGDAVTAALAVVRVAAVADPVVLDCRRFESTAAARACLDAPVVRL